MTVEQLKAKYPHASQSFLRLNAGPSVGAVVAPKPERNRLSPLDGQVKAPRQCSGRVVLCVTLVNFRKSALDDDNLQTALKPMRDSIAASLGVDDRDKRVSWSYSQVSTRGPEGVAVSIVQR